MACGSCATGTCGSTAGGCQSGGGCKTGGCLKLNAFDWLGDMELPGAYQFNIVEVKFKGGRKGYYRNDRGLELYTGDPIVVDAQNGHHIGHVSLQGELVRLQMLKKSVEENEEILSIIRKATEKDLEKLVFVKNREIPTLYRTREIIRDLKLNMKLSDIEYQADNSKATFFYSADDRVDFRELIKLLAGEFKIRVEMRQISLRQEASRLGGIGSCGRELCCSTWLTEFKSVSTAAARYQNLSLNPSKLSGQCGRLKCCLNYELETYIDALVDIPIIEKPLITEKGKATLQKVDIFKKIMWFNYDGETTWHSIDAERAKEILKLNAKGKKVQTLEKEVLAPVAENAGNTKLSSALGKLEMKRQRRKQDTANITEQKEKRRKGKPTAQQEKAKQGKADSKDESKKTFRKRKKRPVSPKSKGGGSASKGNAADKKLNEAAKIAAEAKKRAQQESASRSNNPAKKKPSKHRRGNRNH